ncbi:hypothetical protein C8F04DRAFT_1238107, partial [Mycena alexandri]
MRVTLHTGIEPPESRPCPPLPIDGPILLPVSSSSTAYPEVPTRPAFSTAIAEKTLVDNSEIDTSTMDTSDDSADPKSTVRVKFMPWDASYWLAVTLGILLSVLVIVSSPFARHLSPSTSRRGCSDVHASEFCPAWRDSATEFCPRLDLGDSSLRSCPYLCPTAARRGDVDVMARGLPWTSSALDANHFGMKMCLLSTRRGLVASLARGIISLVAGSLVSSSLIIISQYPSSGIKLKNLFMGGAFATILFKQRLMTGKIKDKVGVIAKFPLSTVFACIQILKLWFM